jgi:cell filamentation protein
MSPDPYVYPGTSVLRNHRGIRYHAELTVVEAEVTALALAGLAYRRIPGGYDLAHLQAFHRAIFGDIYPWAGEVRTVAIAKTGLFCLPEHITSYGAEVFGRLAREQYLQGLDRDAFLVGLTYFYGEINALHPFRDGNGRTQRALLGQLALDADHHISWSRLDAQRNVEASAASLNGDDAALRTLLADLVDVDEHGQRRP